MNDIHQELGGGRPAFIGQIRQYIDERGRRIDECALHGGERPADGVRFVGYFNVQVQTPQGVVQQSRQFRIDAEGIEEAFAGMDAAFAIEKKKLEGPKIIAPMPGAMFNLINGGGRRK